MLNRIYRLVAPKEIKSVWAQLEICSDSVIVRPEHLGICAADRRYFFGLRSKEILKEKLPMALTHEGVGVVLCDPLGKIKAGTKVVMIPNIDDCDRKSTFIKSNYKPQSKFLSSGVDGFMQDVVTMPRENLICLPDDIDNAPLYVLSEPLSIAMNALATLPQMGDLQKATFAVWGDGVMGYMSACAIKYMFPDSPLYVIGKHRRKLDLFSFAKEVYFTDELPVGFQPDVVFECVGGSNSEAALSQIVDVISPQGRIALLGVSENPVLIPTRKILEKGIIAVGCSRSDLQDFIKAIALIHTHSDLRDNLFCIITSQIDVYNERDIERAFESSLLNDFKTLLHWKV